MWKLLLLGKMLYKMQAARPNTTLQIVTIEVLCIFWRACGLSQSKDSEQQGVGFQFSIRRNILLFKVMWWSVIKPTEYSMASHTRSRRCVSAVHYSSPQINQWAQSHTTYITYCECRDLKFKDSQCSHVGGRCCAIYPGFPILRSSWVSQEDDKARAVLHRPGGEVIIVAYNSG